jgi:hypothetical protein
MTDREVFIEGVPFLPLYHRDGRFFRVPGIFAFARRDADGRRTVLHLELTDNIAGRAGPGHPRWSWALVEGMNEVLIHLSGSPAAACGGLVTAVRFHPEMGEPEDAASASECAPGRREADGG